MLQISALLRRTRPSQRLAIRVGLGVLLLAAGLFPWPRLGAAVVGVFCDVANALCSGIDLAGGRALHFDAAAPFALGTRANPDWHVVVTAGSAASGAFARTALNLRAIAYVPTLTFLVFLVAWPGGARRRPWAVGVAGFALTQAYVLVSIALPVVLWLSGEGVQAIDLGETSRALLQTAFAGLVVPPAMSFAIPACLWLLVVAAESRLHHLTFARTTPRLATS